MKRLKSSIVKKILGAVLIIGCSGIFFNGYVGIHDVVYAQEITTNITCDSAKILDEATNTCIPIPGVLTDSMGTWEFLNMLLKVIYLLLWPLLVVAGLSLDNTMVYASVFHLDAPLRKFWNMMKNFANFTLGFMVLFAIIKNFFVTKDEKGPIEIIKKTLIAGILIQASRFLMAALVDISTVATYAVGGLPLNVMKNTIVGNQRILSVSSKIDLNKFGTLNDAGESFKVRYTTTYEGKKIDISPCRVEKNFVIGREFGDKQYKHDDIFNVANSPYNGYEVCVVFNNQLVMREEAAFMQAIAETGFMGTFTGTIKPFDTNKIYYGYMLNLLNIPGRQELDIVKQYAVNINSGQEAAGFIKGKEFYEETSSITLSELINKSKGFVGPLVTMYSSLLNFAQLTDTQTTTIGQTSGVFLIKTGIAIALFFPLLALAIVLIARIGLLRLYIAASPFLVLKKVFDNIIPKDMLGSMEKHLDINNVMKLIFAPVITVAALSISLIFMSALISGFKGDNSQEISANVAENLTITPIQADDPNNQKYKVANNIEIEFENFDRGGGLDWLSWLIVNFFAIGILWTILFAAIKANALGDFIQKNVQDFGANVFQTLPILPFGEGGERVGLGPAFTQFKEAPQTWVKQREYDQETKVKQFIEGTSELPIFTPTQAGTIATKLGGGAEAEEAFKAAGVTIPKAGISALKTQENIEAMYTAINTMSDQTQKTTAKTSLEAIFGGGWFDTKTKNDAKKGLDVLTKDAAYQSELNDIFVTNISANSTTIENYFTARGPTTPYETTTSDGKTYTITRTDTSGTITYSITEKTP